MAKVIVDIMKATDYVDSDGTKMLVSDIKIDDVEFQLHTTNAIKTKEQLAKLAIEHYKKHYREELMGEIEMVI